MKSDSSAINYKPDQLINAGPIDVSLERASKMFHIPIEEMPKQGQKPRKCFVDFQGLPDVDSQREEFLNSESFIMLLKIMCQVTMLNFACLSSLIIFVMRTNMSNTKMHVRLVRIKAGFIIFVEKISNKTYISMSVRSAITRIFKNCVTSHCSVQTYVMSQTFIKMCCTAMDNYGTWPFIKILNAWI